MAQVIHLTTAIFLILIGCHLEYSNNGDIYILLVSLTVVGGKLMGGYQNWEKSVAVMEERNQYSWQFETKKEYASFKDDPKYQIFMWKWLINYNSFPFEIFFAVSDSLKYLQFVYLAKWVNR